LFTSCKKQSKESSETSRSSGFWIPPFLETTFCIRTKHMINPSCYSSSLTSELEWCFFWNPSWPNPRRFPDVTKFSQPTPEIVRPQLWPKIAVRSQ
jgi:hypothetical protein